MRLAKFAVLGVILIVGWMMVTAGRPGRDRRTTVKVSSNDKRSGYLNGKLIVGAGIDFTEANNGGNETLAISCEEATSTNLGIAAFDADDFDDSVGRITLSTIAVQSIMVASQRIYANTYTFVAGQLAIAFETSFGAAPHAVAMIKGAEYAYYSDESAGGITVKSSEGTSTSDFDLFLIGDAP